MAGVSWCVRACVCARWKWVSVMKCVSSVCVRSLITVYAFRDHEVEWLPSARPPCHTHYVFPQPSRLLVLMVRSADRGRTFSHAFLGSAFIVRGYKSHTILLHCADEHLTDGELRRVWGKWDFSDPLWDSSRGSRWLPDCDFGLTKGKKCCVYVCVSSVLALSEVMLWNFSGSG